MSTLSTWTVRPKRKCESDQPDVADFSAKYKADGKTVVCYFPAGTWDGVR